MVAVVMSGEHRVDLGPVDSGTREPLHRRPPDVELQAEPVDLHEHARACSIRVGDGAAGTGDRDRRRHRPSP
jgi:hypothetical protein